jgi:hypothetical protein
VAAEVMFAVPAHASGTGSGDGTGPKTVVITGTGSGDGTGPKAVAMFASDPPIIRG